VIGRIKHKGLAELHGTGKTRWISADRIRKCIRILQLLDAASKPEDMNIAGLHFHSLEGRAKRWSVRVTANDRITFGWSGEAALDIDLEDYH
jgi:toxin HigB-1